MAIELEPGERLVWQGAPAPGLKLRPFDAIAIPFALFWLGLFGAGLAEAARDRAIDPIFAYLFVPLGLAIGLFLLAGRFVAEALARRRTEYALTDRRAIVRSGGARGLTRSVNLAAVAEIRFRPAPRGRGTIAFGPPHPFAGLPRGWPIADAWLPPAFDDVEEARHVFALALKSQRDSLRGLEPAGEPAGQAG